MKGETWQLAQYSFATKKKKKLKDFDKKKIAVPFEGHVSTRKKNCNCVDKIGKNKFNCE